MPHTEHKCPCGKEFTQFRYYKEHIINRKCHPISTESPLININTSDDTQPTTLQNDNTFLPNIYQPELEPTQITNGQIHQGNIAYKSSHTNINPKTMCNFCNKLYSKHNIKSHKLKCKHKYKDSYQYKLLVRAGISNIPESYIDVVELFNKLNNETPHIFTNLPPSINQVDDITDELPRNGRPRKQKQPQTFIEQQINQEIGQQINNNTTNNTTNNSNTTNNITNNNQQNINIFLNPICNESVAHITPERQMYIILQRLHAFKEFIDSVYEAPANHNICITDRKGEKVKYLDKEHGINNGSAKNIIGDIAMARTSEASPTLSHLGQIDNFIETHKDNVPEHRQNDLKFLEAFLLNENNNESVIKELNDKVSVLSGSSKLLLDKYQKQMAIDYINSLPEPDDP